MRTRKFLDWLRKNRKTNERANKFLLYYNSNYEFNDSMKESGIRNVLQKNGSVLVNDFEILVQQYKDEHELQVVRY